MQLGEWIKHSIIYFCNQGDNITRAQGIEGIGKEYEDIKDEKR